MIRPYIERITRQEAVCDYVGCSASVILKENGTPEIGGWVFSTCYSLIDLRPDTSHYCCLEHARWQPSLEEKLRRGYS